MEEIIAKVKELAESNPAEIKPLLTTLFENASVEDKNKFVYWLCEEYRGLVCNYIL